jgi:2-dehydropantoate 2-reductase
MKIVVIGPGAIGCLLAAYLTKVGADICLLDYRPERASLLRQQGIEVEREGGGFHTPVKATANPSETRSAELFLLCVKAVDTEGAAAPLRGIISENSCFLTLQNGLGNVEKLGELFGRKRVLAGVISHGATLINVGHVRHAGHGEIRLGPSPKIALSANGKQKLDQLALTLNQAKLKGSVARDIENIIWRKLLANVGINALTCILRVPNGKLLDSPECQELMSKAIAEAVTIAHHYGIELDTAKEIDRVKDICRSTAANHSSMLQDVKRKRKTEIDHLNGAVVQMATCYNISVPVNEVLAALVRSIEAGYRVL